jgi:septum formation protein
MLVPFADKLSQMKTVLGSQSPRRRELLSGIIKNFEVIPSQFDESTINQNDYKDPKEFVREQSMHKAEEITSRVKDADIIITADTIVTFDGKILGKPKTHDVAYEMISQLSGREHEVVTGVFVSFPKLGKKISFTETTLVHFDKLPEEVIKAYADSDDPLDKAGAYGIQSGAMSLINKIDGDYFNVVGLPVHRLAKEIYNVLSETN